MSKLTLSDVSNISGAETSAINTINSNWQAIENALENTFSLDGTSPNSLGTDLDLDGNDIMNVGTITTTSLVLDGVTVASSSLTAKGDKGDQGDPGPQGPAGTSSPPADTSTEGILEVATFAEAIAGTPTNLAIVSDVMKQIIDMICPVGTISAFAQSTAPTYWLELNGQTIGSASSGATGRANNDTLNLFTLLWNNTTNSELSIQTSTGVPSTRGISAAADFSANKRLPLPNARGQFLRALDNGQGVDTGRTLLSIQTDLVKAHTHTGSADSAGNHTHSVPAGLGGRFGANHYAAGSDNAAWSSGDSTWGSSNPTFTASSAGAHTHNLTINANTGAENRPTNLSVLYAIRY